MWRIFVLVCGRILLTGRGLFLSPSFRCLSVQQFVHLPLAFGAVGFKRAQFLGVFGRVIAVCQNGNLVVDTVTPADKPCHELAAAVFVGDGAGIDGNAGRTVGFLTCVGVAAGGFAAFLVHHHIGGGFVQIKQVAVRVIPYILLSFSVTYCVQYSFLLVGIDYAVKAAFAVCPDGLLDYFRCNGFGQFHAVKLADKGF